MRPQINTAHSSILFAGILTLIVLWVVSFFNLALPISVSNRTVSGELSVVGEGQVDVVPDLATVQVGIVVSDGSTIEQVESSMNETNNKIVDALTALGIKKEDIKTSNYSINPNYNYSPNGTSTIDGYNGNATLSVKVRSTDNLPKVIQAATGAGANQVYDTQYTVDDPDKYREQAREEAIANAKAQAQKLASQLGIRLGKIVNIVESSSNGGVVPMLYKDERASLGGGVPAPDLQPGSQTITSTVTLYFEKR